MSRPVNEHILKRRLAHRDRLDLAGKSFNHVRDKPVALFAFDPHLVLENRRLHVKPGPNVLRQQPRVVRRIQQDHVAADFALQFRRSSQRHQVALVQDRQPVAALGLFHQVSRDQHRNMLFVAQHLQVLPQVAACSGIESSRRLIQ